MREDEFCKATEPTVGELVYSGDAWCSAETVVKKLGPENQQFSVYFDYKGKDGSTHEVFPTVAIYDKDWTMANADSISFSTTTKKRSLGDFTDQRRAVANPVQFVPKDGVTGIEIDFTCQNNIVAVAYLNPLS